MKITKYGHCCLLIEEKDLRILTDPAYYSAGYEALENIDVILITHEHADHFHLDSLKAVLAHNPQAKVVTNRAVGALMEKEGLSFEILEHGQENNYKEVLIEGIGEEHAVIHPSVPNVQNTGYFIGKKLFYPGDALTDPGRQVDILALPVSAPWVKVSEAIDYANAVKPKVWIPVHDGILKFPEKGYEWVSWITDPMGLRGEKMEHGKEVDF